MGTVFKSLYSDSEKLLLEKLNELFEDWNKAWQEYRNAHPDGYGVTDHEEIVPDGFYPKYLDQKTKILFIGRESYTLEGCNYIDVFIEHYLAGRTRKNNSRPINQDKFHKMLIQVAYGLINDQAWEDVPYAGNICEDGRIFEKISFAFMNLSKLSNELVNRENTNTDWNLVYTALEMSVGDKRNFIFEETQLLDPDIIICMNWERSKLQLVFGDALEVSEKEWLKYTLHLNNRKVLLLDQWHFSSRKSEEDDIYLPIYKAWKEFSK